MSDRLDEDIRLWAQQEIAAANKAGWSSANILWTFQFSPGLGQETTGHKILYWPWGRRVAKIARAAHQLTVDERMLLIASAGVLLDDEGKPLKDDEFCRFSNISVRKLPAYINKAKTKLRKLLKIN